MCLRSVCELKFCENGPWVDYTGSTDYYYYYYFFFFVAALGLRCCAQAFSGCGERGLLFVAVRRLLIAVASLVAEHRL